MMIKYFSFLKTINYGNIILVEWWDVQLALSFLRFLMYVQSFLLLDENVPFSSSDEIRELT